MGLISYKTFKTFIFDLDGTIWRWTQPINNAVGVVEKLRSRGKKVYFMSNNSALTREKMAQKLRDFGFKAEDKHVLNGAYLAAKYLENKGVRKAYVLGEPGLVEQLGEHGIQITEQKPDAVLVSVDRSFSYRKLAQAKEFIDNGAEFYAIGYDQNWFVGNQKFPGAAGIIAAVEAVTGKKATLLGKPSVVAKKVLTEEFFLFPEDTVFVGDHLESDIIFAHNCGFKGVLVTTGESSEKQGKEATGLAKPDDIIPSLEELVRFF